MVFLLAPKLNSKSSLQISKTIVRIADNIICNIKQFPKVFSAELLSFLPIKIEARGAPPALTNAAKDVENVKAIFFRDPIDPVLFTECYKTAVKQFDGEDSFIRNDVINIEESPKNLYDKSNNNRRYENN